MLIDDKNKTIQIEPRDINYILPSYIKLYLFYTRGEEIKAIVFPMFSSVLHPETGEPVSIEWIPPTDPVAVSIIEDGKDVPEIAPAQEARLDAKDEEIKKLKKELADMQQQRVPPSTTQVDTKEEKKIMEYPKPKTTKQSSPTRQPKMPPSGDIGPGVSPSNMGNRDVKLERQIRQDLRDEPGVDESKEIEAEIEKPQ